MKLRILLKTTLMLGLVVVGRMARDAERTNPGRSINQILKTQAAARANGKRVPGSPMIQAQAQTATLHPMLQLD